MSTMSGQFVVQPTPLAVVWTQTYPDGGRSHFASDVYGWVTSSRDWTPHPVVLHPRDRKLTSLGLDTIGSVSTLEMFPGLSGSEVACVWRDKRREDDATASAAALCEDDPEVTA